MSDPIKTQDWEQKPPPPPPKTPEVYDFTNDQGEVVASVVKNEAKALFQSADERREFWDVELGDALTYRTKDEAQAVAETIAAALGKALNGK